MLLSTVALAVLLFIMPLMLSASLNGLNLVSWIFSSVDLAIRYFGQLGMPCGSFIHSRHQFFLLFDEEVDASRFLKIHIPCSLAARTANKDGNRAVGLNPGQMYQRYRITLGPLTGSL